MHRKHVSRQGLQPREPFSTHGAHYRAYGRIVARAIGAASKSVMTAMMRIAPPDVGTRDGPPGIGQYTLLLACNVRSNLAATCSKRSRIAWNSVD